MLDTNKSDVHFDAHWKSFENNEISHSEAHYLLSIYSLSKKSEVIRAIDLSKDLSVSRNAVSLQLKRLQERNFVKVDGTQIKLSVKGQKTIEKIASKRETVKVFLTEVLGLRICVSEEDACKIEHLLSDETSAALLNFTKYLRSGRKPVVKFLKEFQKSTVKCNPKIGCGLCENIEKLENHH